MCSGRKVWLAGGLPRRGVAAQVVQWEYAGAGRKRVCSKAVRVVMDDAAVPGFTPGFGKRPSLLAVLQSNGTASRDAITQTLE